MQKYVKTLQIAIFFGGPSNEKNISLDSARTFFDLIHTLIPQKNIFLIFFSKKLKPFLLNERWIYSNTIEDFEDLLKKTTQKTNTEIDENQNKSLSNEELEKIIRTSDILMPLIHGSFGEDGELIKLFIKQKNYNWIGSDEQTLKLSLNKYQTLLKLQQMGFYTTRVAFFNSKKEKTNTIIKKAKTILQIENQDILFVKPNDGGSSDGVSCVKWLDAEKSIELAKRFSQEILIEKKIYGREFSIIILQDIEGKVIPLFPSEIEIEKEDKDENKKLNFYTRRKKYMPGSGAYHRTPANFEKESLEKIRQEASAIFEALNFQHWARFDGFLCKDKKIVWSELNAIPGMGIDSFLFQQCALANINAQQICLLLMANALKKTGKELVNIQKKKENNIKEIAIIGGGESSEKQVSRMSWHNVCLKLSSLPQYKIKCIYMDSQKILWLVPRALTLFHTIEEIDEVIKERKEYEKKRKEIYHSLKEFVLPKEIEKEKNEEIKKISPSFLKKSDYTFIALHGGVGEDGTLQKTLEKYKIKYNGSDSNVSFLCSDKQKLNRYVADLKLEKIEILENFSIELDELRQWLEHKKIEILKIGTKNILERDPKWKKFKKEISFFFDEKFSKHNFNWKEFVIKPAKDGCSTGVLVLKSNQEKKNKIKIISYYLNSLLNEEDHLQMHYVDELCKKDKEQRMLLPKVKEGKLKLMVEKLIDGTQKDFMELTITVLGKKGQMKALLPSETLSERSALSLEEKFNKGVGANLTPPRKLKKKEIDEIRKSATLLANKLEIADYARIDFFYSITQRKLYLIEVNTLPGLTSATILFTQALITNSTKVKPAELLHKIIEIKS